MQLLVRTLALQAMLPLRIQKLKILLLNQIVKLRTVNSQIH